MRRLPHGPIWLAVAAVGLGLFAYSLGLDRSDKLASIGSFVLAVAALAAAARTYLRPSTCEATPSADPDSPSDAKYAVSNYGSIGQQNMNPHGPVTLNVGHLPKKD
jgi:hypothetical protein